MDVLAVVGLALAASAWFIVYLWPVPRIVREYESALHYRKGHLLSRRGPGRYWLRRRVDELILFDMRRQQMIVAGQEVLTQDRVPIKLSVLAEYSVTDVEKAASAAQDYTQHLYGHLQIAVRAVLAMRDLDGALADRGAVGRELKTAIEPVAEGLGIELHDVHVRDYMMGGGLRSAYADVIQARQQGLAALERARGESAALRNLANSAQLLEGHPGLMKLRVLQALEGRPDARIHISLDGSSVADSPAGKGND